MTNENNQEIMENKKRRKYYILWMPRGFLNEKEVIAVTGLDKAIALKNTLSEYEQHNLSRNTVRMVTRHEALTVTNCPENGDIAVSELNELKKDPASYSGFDRSALGVGIRKLLRYW